MTRRAAPRYARATASADNRGSGCPCTVAPNEVSARVFGTSMPSEVFWTRRMSCTAICSQVDVVFCSTKAASRSRRALRSEGAIARAVSSCSVGGAG